MFTGIVETQVKVLEYEGQRLRVENPWKKKEIWMGQSVCVDGCCLTIVDYGRKFIEFDVSAETASKTHFQGIQANSIVNIERAMGFRGSFDGHFVTGHVDDVAQVKSIERVGKGNYQIYFEVPSKKAIWIAPKGSVAINGVSLTVNDVRENCFSVNIIPHTWSETNISGFYKGQKVNIEFDVLAKYVDRIVASRLPQSGSA